MQREHRPWAALARAAAFALLVGAFAFAPGVRAESRQVLVFAAASLKNALDDAAAAWNRETGRRAVVSYAASNTLAKQLEAGAPADIFFSADTDWMDYAASKDLIRPDSRVDLLGNAIVLIAPRDAAVQVEMGPGFDLAPVLGSGHLAMGNVSAVPAGKYGKAALEKLGAWDGVKDKVVQAESARAALLLVSRGEAPLGIVYRTDAASDPGVKIIANFPADSHPAIIYPLALTKVSSSPDARSFVDFLRSPLARSLFERQGFVVMNKPASGS